MKTASQFSFKFELGSRAWREAKCYEGQCQGTVCDDHPERARSMKRAYKSLSDDDLLAFTLAGKCGPNCLK
jgi:hypothetical protein